MPRPSSAALVAAALLAALLLSPAQAATDINVGELSVDGLVVRELKCSLNSGGFMGPITVVGALAQQRGTIDACTPTGGAFRATWTWAAGKVVSLKVDASSPADKAGCFEKALQAASPSLDGSCSALVLAGDAAGAEKAAAALKPPPP